MMRGNSFGVSREFVALFLAGAFLTAATAVLWPLSVAAQQQGQWAADAQIPDYLEDTFTPVLIADPYGWVHAFASQWVGEVEPQQALVYSKWAAESGWTEPVDVLLAPTGDARVIDAFLDTNGTFHVVFWGGDPNRSAIYHSMAPVADAWQAPAWTTPQVVGINPSYLATGALVGDGNRNLVILYGGVRDGNGVYAVYSTDEGESWSDPYPVFLTYDKELSPYSVDASLGENGQVHAVWNVVTASGTDLSLYYSRFDISRGEWTLPIMLEERVDEPGYFGPSYPRIVDAGQRLIVMYNSGNPFADRPVALGRPVQVVRISVDGGDTWSGATAPFPQLNGRSGEHAMVVDSNNEAHALFIQRVDVLVDGKYQAVGGIQHSRLQGERWSEPQNFKSHVAAHDLRAVVSQGNVLLMVWRQDPGTGKSGVWYSYTTLESPRLSTEAMPVVLPTPTPTATPTPTSTATPASRALALSTIVPAGNEAKASASMPEGPAALLIVAAAPVLLILAAAFVLQVIKRHGWQSEHLIPH